MTRGSEPTDAPPPDSLSSESERRRWQHKRAQFDTAINTARLLGVVQNLALGSMEASEALRIILEVNASKDQAQYVAEMLAMKKEFRDLARLEYRAEVAKFILEGSRLVPALTGGLASQMLMAMGHAAQNDAYLETVSSAVSTLLSDLDHPLMPDARNYLRLLWDQMEATRRLTQTEALYTGQRVPSERAAERRSSGSLAAVKLASAGAPEAAKAAAAQETTAPARTAGSISPSRTMIGIGQAPLVAHAESPESATPSKKRWVEAAPSEVRAPAVPPERPSPTPAVPSAPAESIEPAASSAPSKRWVEADATGVASPAEDEIPSPKLPIEPPLVIQPVSASKVVDVAEVDEKRESAPKIAAEPEATNSPLNIMGRVWREARASKPPVPAEPIAGHSASRLAGRPEAPPQRESTPKIAPSLERGQSSSLPAPTGFEPTLLQHEQDFFATGEREPESTAQMPPFEQHATREPSVLIADTRTSETHSDTLPGARQRQASRDELKVPTRGVPKWAIATVVAVALAGSGLVLSLSLTSESENKSESPKGSASAAKRPAPSASVSPAPSLARRPLRTSAQSSSAATPPPPPAPPPATEPQPVPAAQPRHAVPKTQEPSPPVRPSKPQSAPSHVQGRAPTPAPVAEPTSKKPSVEAAPKGPTVVTPPEVAKTLSPLDRIIAEIRLISPDPVGIEDKARELARIIARSKRKEAGQIIEKLGPPIAVDPLSRDSTLEESLQTFAVSVLGRVATDDDDNRAVDALLMLGEWVSNGGKGKQKALSALQTLSHESIIKLSAPRLRALKTAQAQAD